MSKMTRNTIVASLFFLIAQISFVNAGSTESEELKNNKSSDTATECWEGASRAMFKFNYALDGAIFEPVSKGYRTLPKGFRTGTSNIVNNLRSLLTVSNNILQGDFKKAGTTAGRFAVNTTV